MECPLYLSPKLNVTSKIKVQGGSTLISIYPCCEPQFPQKSWGTVLPCSASRLPLLSKLRRAGIPLPQEQELPRSIILLIQMGKCLKNWWYKFLKFLPVIQVYDYEERIMEMEWWILSSYFFKFGGSRSRGNTYVVRMGENRTQTYAKHTHKHWSPGYWLST